jgi:hypothetical protein
VTKVEFIEFSPEAPVDPIYFNIQVFHFNLSSVLLSWSPVHTEECLVSADERHLGSVESN